MAKKQEPGTPEIQAPALPEKPEHEIALEPVAEIQERIHCWWCC
jgi:hypothetical protein